MVAIVMRIVCRRYCGVNCTSRCVHKQDPADEESSSAGEDVNSRGIVSASDLQQQRRGATNIQQVQLQVPSPARLEHSLFGQMPLNVHPYRGVVIQSHNARVAVSGYGGLVPRPGQPREMLTVPEEEEMDEQQQQRSLQSLESISSNEDPGTMFTVYTFPQHQISSSSSSAIRFSGHSIALSSYAPVHLALSCVGESKKHVTDLPPSYDDLFPVTEGSETPASELDEKKLSTKETQDVSIDVDRDEAH